MTRILVLGGDGYLGWPMSAHLSARGHDVLAVDNYLRRRICRETDSEPLFEVPNLMRRAAHWKDVSGKVVEVRIGDLDDWGFMAELFQSFKPEAVIHFAEQPSAPYSMMDVGAARLTLMNNLGVTFNLIQAAHRFAPHCHIVKLGTMGEYGTPNIDIEEGWIDIEHKGRRDRFLYPRQAGSLYHTTKIMDTDLLWFYVRTWGLRVTDLMQGPVYGLATGETEADEALLPALNYDEIFGTVFNRFMVQAVAGYPLTVYGKGGQTRGYLNIRDTMECVRLAVDNPAGPGELRIFNQFVETFSVNSIAERVAEAGRELGLAVEVRSVENPRLEKEEHYYNPAHVGLTGLGFEPYTLTTERLMDMMRRIQAYGERIRPDLFLRGVKWN